MSGANDTITVCADNDGVVDESNEDNNCMENTFIFVYELPVANFTVDNNITCVNTSVNFTDLSTPIGQIDSRSWDFPGGSPSTASTQRPHIVTYSAAGNYTVTYTYTVTNASGQGDINIVLFDSDHYTLNDTVTIHIEITAGYEPYNATATPPRWDLAPIFDYYDPYMNYRDISTECHIEDWQPAESPLSTTGYDVPYILVIPVTGWSAPAEGTTITDVYPYFDDYYHTGAPDDWYE
jgi:PKD repeat protein